jgi:hypothetical protein
VTTYTPTPLAQRGIAEQLGIDPETVVRMQCALEDTTVRSIEIDTMIDGAFITSTYLIM